MPQTRGFILSDSNGETIYRSPEPKLIRNYIDHARLTPGTYHIKRKITQYFESRQPPRQEDRVNTWKDKTFNIAARQNKSKK